LGARSFLGSGRNPQLRSAAQSYVERVELAAGASQRSLRAATITRDVLTALCTAERANLTYRFANFFVLLRMAGADPLHPLLEPPVLASDARRLLERIVRPDWIQEEGVLRAPQNEGFRVFPGDIPRLSCLGFMLFEVFPELLVTHARSRATSGTELAAGEFLKEINRALARLQADEGQSEHTTRKFFALIQGLEEAAGRNFEISSLRDDHILSVWLWLASGDSGVKRYTETLRMLAELTEAIRTGEAAGAVQQAAVIDDPLLAARVSEGGLEGDDTRSDAALSDDLVATLLTKSQAAMVSVVLVDFACLSGIYLSRARALAFGPFENKLIQAKRDRRDPASVVASLDGGANAFAAKGAELTEIIAALAQFVGVAVLLAWEAGEHGAALEAAVAAGFVSADQAEAILATEQPGPLAATLQAGTLAWRSLRRRAGFATMQEKHAEMSEAAGHAVYLLAALSRHAKRITAAIEPYLAEQQYRAEVAHFLDALMQVHAKLEEDAK
jgi:hypothetical protein